MTLSPFDDLDMEVEDARSMTAQSQVLIGTVVAIERRGPSLLTLIYQDGRQVSLLATEDTWEFSEEGLPKA